MFLIAQGQGHKHCKVNLSLYQVEKLSSYRPSIDNMYLQMTIIIIVK